MFFFCFSFVYPGPRFTWGTGVFLFRQAKHNVLFFGFSFFLGFLPVDFLFFILLFLGFFLFFPMGGPSSACCRLGGGVAGFVGLTQLGGVSTPRGDCFGTNPLTSLFLCGFGGFFLSRLLGGHQGGGGLNTSPKGFS